MRRNNKPGVREGLIWERSEWAKLFVTLWQPGGDKELGNKSQHSHMYTNTETYSICEATVENMSTNVKKQNSMPQTQ